MDYKLNRSWAEVNLDHIAHNINEIKKILDSKCEICAVVKADAYGHGVTGITQTLLDSGVNFFAVSMLDEAIQLRRNGLKKPILVLGYTDPIRADEIINHEITQTVFSLDLAMALSDTARKLGRNIKIHIKVDTGMTRIGFMTGYSTVQNIEKIFKLPGIILEGLFTHFASADEEDKSYTYMQFERFISLCTELERVGIYIPIKHVCNSAGIIEFPHMHLNMVRPGICLYGHNPSTHVNTQTLNLKPSMTLKTNIVMIKDVEKGTCISYGRKFTTCKQSRIATLPIGYADGYTRLLTGKGKVLINGQFAPIVGTICMDQCMIDISHVNTDVSLGDEVILFGKQNGKEIRIEDLASEIGTINYELLCLIGKRVPRVYIKNGNIQHVMNYLT